MPKLSQWDVAELEDIRRKDKRYQALSDQLIASATADELMPEDDYDELHRLESDLADSVKRLLGIIDVLQG